MILEEEWIAKGVLKYELKCLMIIVNVNFSITDRFQFAELMHQPLKSMHPKRKNWVHY